MKNAQEIIEKFLLTFRMVQKRTWKRNWQENAKLELLLNKMWTDNIIHKKPMILQTLNKKDIQMKARRFICQFWVRVNYPLKPCLQKPDVSFISVFN